MTESKMIRILESYEDTPLFELIDEWDYDFKTDKFTKKVRDIILLSDVIDEFKNKSGNYYNHYHITDSFKELCKLIESGKTIKTEVYYDDTSKFFDEQWKIYHPDITYKEWVHKNNERNIRNLETFYRDMCYNYFPWECSTMPYHLINYRK